MTRRYTIILENLADGGYHTFCPALPECDRLIMEPGTLGNNLAE